MISYMFQQKTGKNRSNDCLLYTSELEVTSLKGRIQLPECPEEISAAYEEDAFFSHTFSGWTEDPSEEGSSLLTSGSSFDTKGREQISLYSVWESADKYQFGIKKESKDKYVVYILIDNNTGEPVSVPEGYSLSYQWQIAQQGDCLLYTSDRLSGLRAV